MHCTLETSFNSTGGLRAETLRTPRYGRGLHFSGSMTGHGRHLRMHSPVVVVAVGHPAPSGAPVEQTTDTSVSFAPQATVFSPVTMRNPALPAGPGGPA